MTHCKFLKNNKLQNKPCGFLFYWCLWSNLPIEKYITAQVESAILSTLFYSEVGSFFEREMLQLTSWHYQREVDLIRAPIITGILPLKQNKINPKPAKQKEIIGACQTEVAPTT